MAPTRDDNARDDNARDNARDNDKRRQRRTKRPPPEPSNILKRFYALYDDKIRYFKKKVSKLYCLFNRNSAGVPIWEHGKKPFR